jgi:TolB-like protein/Flp pilus assembly protein TadD
VAVLTETGKAVFLSYASQDVEAAQNLCNALRGAGIEVWFDQSELRGGDVWDQKIRRQIKECALLIALISANTQSRTEGYFRREWKIAVDRTQDMADDRAFIVPVLIDATSEAEARVPEQFFRAHITRLPDGQTPPQFVAQIQRLLQPSAPEPPSRPASRAPSIDSTAPVHASRRLPAMGIAAFGLAILGGGYLWLTHHSTPAAPGSETTTGASISSPAPDPRSIAVLPFLDMSEGKDQEYMSDGLAEELLNLLARIPGLRVTSRSSAFSFKGKTVDAPEIARRLHIANILEGSVRKSGNRLRIDAQLIDARSDTSLWSETYQRSLEDIFAVQDEIAAAVVAQLKITLLGAAAKTTVTDPRAYALFLQARPLARQHTPAGYEQSNVLYQQALAIDANYAPAWDGLAYNYRRQANNGMRPLEEGYKLAREALGKALAIDPKYAPSVAALGRIALDHDGDFAMAARQLERAMALAPTDADIIYTTARVAEGLGRLKQSMPFDEYALQHDPLNPTLQNIVGIDYRYAGRFDQSIAAFRKVLQLSPGNISAHYRLGEALLSKRDYAAALAAIQQEPNEGWRLVGLPMVYYSLGDKAKSDAALAELIPKHGQRLPSMVAYVLAYRGDIDGAFDWLEKAVSAHDPSLATLVVEPLYAPLYKDPRWLPFLRKIGRAPEQLNAIKLDVKLPGP